MRQNLVLTVIGDDRPGLVEKLATVISAHGGNWLESSMSHLAGKFAGLLRVEIDGERAAQALIAQLSALPELRVHAERSDPPAAPAAGRRFVLSLVGHDRIGIVREVSAVLARHAVNVERLTTSTASAPMSAETLFNASAELLAAPGFASDELQHDLERISSDLMVEVTLAEG